MRILRNRFGQKFQGNKAAERGILRLVHHTHPAAAQFFEDAIVRDGLLGRGWVSATLDVKPATLQHILAVVPVAIETIVDACPREHVVRRRSRQRKQCDGRVPYDGRFQRRFTGQQERVIIAAPT